MFIWKRHGSYFKTLSGKVYPASKYTFQFLDSALEAQYVNYLAFKTFPLFRLISLMTSGWVIIVVLFRYLTDAWYPRYAYFIPMVTAAYAPLSVWIGARILKSRRYRK